MWIKSMLVLTLFVGSEAILISLLACVLPGAEQSRLLIGARETSRAIRRAYYQHEAVADQLCW